MIFRQGVLIGLSFLFGLNAIADVQLPDRRKPQFLTETGYYVFPTPYSLPGLGEGILAVGALTNAYHNYSDIYAFAAAGDLEGVALLKLCAERSMTNVCSIR